MPGLSPTNGLSAEGVQYADVGLVQGLSTVNSAAAAEANAAAIQAALNAGGLVQITQPGTYYVNDSVVTTDNSTVFIAAGVVIKKLANANRSIFTNSNANRAYTGSLPNISGVTILYADTQAAGSGTLSYTNSGQTLKWAAPNDSVGGAVSVGAGGVFKLASASAGRALYIRVSANYLPGADKSDLVKVSGTKGAQSCTCSLTSNVMTVTETAHGRAVGDSIDVRGLVTGTAGNGSWEIATVPSADTYTVNITASNFGAESAAVFGSKNIAIVGDGIIDGNGANQTAGAFNENYDILMRNVTNFRTQGLRFLNNQQRAISVYGCTNHTLQDHECTGTKVFCQWEGPGNRIVVRNIKSQGTDDLLAWTNTANTGTYSWNGGALGDFDNVVVSDIEAAGHLNMLKITGSAGYTFKSMTFSKLRGTITNAVAAIVDDTSSLTGGAANNLTFNDVDCTVGASGQDITVTMTGTIKNLNINGLRHNATGTCSVALGSGTTVNSCLINGHISVDAGETSSIVLSGGTVGVLAIDNFRYNLNASGAGGVYISAGTPSLLRFTNGHVTGANTKHLLSYEGTPANVMMDNIWAGTIADLVANGGGASTGTVIQISNFNGTPKFIAQLSRNCTLNLSNIAGTFSSLMVYAYGSTTLTLNANNITTTSTHLATDGTALVNVNGPSLKVDINTTKVNRTDGSVVYNTNSALGTLGAAGLVVCQGTAANSWKLLSDTTKTY